MKKRLAESEGIKLNRLDTRILIALLCGGMNGYQLARRCEADLGDGAELSNGSLYPALARLQAQLLVEAVKLANGDRVYKLTPTGRLVIGWEVSGLQRLVRVARERLR